MVESNEIRVIDLERRYEGCGEVCKLTASKWSVPSPPGDGEVRV